MGSGGGHTTNFSSHTLEALKAMVRDAQPDKVDEIADHWMYVHDQLAGDAPDGSVRDLLEKAIADVREYWHGAAAEAFEARAKVLSTSLKNGSLYAKNTSHTLKSAAIDLRNAQRAVTALQDSESDSKGGNVLQAIGSKIQDGADWLSDFGARSDDGLKQDLAKGMGTGDALEKNRGTLSRGREIALEAAAYMERLGASYNVKAQTLQGPRKREPDAPVAAPDSTVPPPDVAAGVMPVVASPRKAGSGSGGRQTVGTSTSAGGAASPRPGHVGGGTDSPAEPGARTSVPKAPLPGTALDGVRGGVPTPSIPPAPGGGGPAIGGTPGESGSGPGGPAMPIGGKPSAGGRGRFSSRTARPGAPGGPSTPPGARSGSGKSAIPGSPGQPGRAGRPPIGGVSGSGAAGKGAAGGRQGGLARRPGGVIGEPGKPGTPGRGAQGGSGLHRSRGGSLSGGSGTTSPGRGTIGVPPGGRSARDEKERRQRSRPDYLVEDEETWVSQRDTVPEVVGVTAPVENAEVDVPEQQGGEAEKDRSEGSGKA